jgi:hypothetical protein
MDIDGFDRASQFAAEAGPAVSGEPDARLLSVIHHDDISRTDQRAHAAPDAGPFIYRADHGAISCVVTVRL